MKKIFLTFVMAVICSFSFGQTWDNIKWDLADGEKVNFNVEPYSIQFRDSYVYTDTIYEVVTEAGDTVYLVSEAIPEKVKSCKISYFVENTYYHPGEDFTYTKFLPSTVYDRYAFGENLMIGGWITLGLGGVFSIVGGVLAGTSKSNLGKTTGYAMLGAGGAMLTVSIPLLSFGNSAKREANVVYDVFNLY